jgi:hypothetical protein
MRKSVVSDLGEWQSSADHPGGRSLIRVAGVSTICLSMLYLAILAIGFQSLSESNQAIADPWFALLEILILFLMPALVLLFAAIHELAPPNLKPASLSAAVVMGQVAVLTMLTHFTILLLGRMPDIADADWALFVFSFRWPSVAYVLDVVAWDLLYPIALLFAVWALRDLPAARGSRAAMIAAAALSFAGLGGAALGDMHLRNIGILGYGVLTPVYVALLLHGLRQNERACSAQVTTGL